MLVVGDHGESLGEHGELTHGLLVYEATLHVPLLLAAPGADAHEVKTPVSSIDIAPTLAQLAGLKLDRADGIALSAQRRAVREGSLRRERSIRRPSDGARLSAIRRGASKLISNRELYDLERDPNEKTNTMQNDRRTFRALETSLLEIRKSEAAASTQTTVDEETRRKLASLGYVAPSGAPSEGDHADPVAMTPLFRQFEEATWALNGGRVKEAIATFTKLTSADPRNPVFRESLGRALRQSGDNEAAVRLYRESVAIAPGERRRLVQPRRRAAGCRASRRSGDRDSRGASPRSTSAPRGITRWAWRSMSEGNVRGAEEEFRRTIALDPRNARGWNNLGNVLRATNRLDEARTAYTQSIDARAELRRSAEWRRACIDVQQDRPARRDSKFRRGAAHRAELLRSAAQSRHRAEDGRRRDRGGRAAAAGFSRLSLPGAPTTSSAPPRRSLLH